jgi:hypothetical protein
MWEMFSEEKEIRRIGHLMTGLTSAYQTGVKEERWFVRFLGLARVQVRSSDRRGSVYVVQTCVFLKTS